MPMFQVQIDAKNLLVKFDGRVAKHGFITTRLIEAATPDDAEEAALQSVLDDEELTKLIQNDPTDPPCLDVVEIAEFQCPSAETVQPGRIWYPETPKHWWQFWRR